MGPERKPPQNPQELRKETEAPRQSGKPRLQEMSPEAIRALVHELQAHQTELEMQNETLRQAQADLEESSQKSSNFYDIAPVGLLTLDKSGVIKDANLTAARQLGVARDRLIHKPLRFFIRDADRDRFRLCLDLLVQEPAAPPCEIRLQRPDGNAFYARLDSVPVQAILGEPACFISITDISELKLAEQKLQESQRLFTSFLGHLPSVAIIRDLEGRYLFVNAAWEQTFHKAREAWLGKTTDDLWPPEVAEKFKMQDRQVLATGKPLRTVGTLRHADGLHLWVSHRFPIVDADGRPVMIGINAIDVTEPMATKTRLERLLASSPAAVYTCKAGADLAFTYISDNVTALVGWEPRDFLADPRFWLNHLHPEDRPQVLQKLAFPWPQDHQTSEYRFLAKDGAYRDMLAEVNLVRDPEGQPLEYTGAWMDISARKHLEQELLEAHNRLQTLVQASPLPIAAVDREGRITLWNPAAARTFGWSEAEVMGRPNPIVPPESALEFRQVLARLMEGEFLEALELKRRRKDGALLDIRLFAAPLYDPQGESVGAMAVLEDITEAKQVREALGESEAKFRATFDQAPIGVAVVSLDYRFQRVNAELCRLTGYSQAELTVLTPLAITHPEDREASAARMASLAKGEIDHYQVDKRYIRKDGQRTWVRLSVRLVRDAEGAPLYYLSMVEDITARKESETILHKERQRFFSLLDLLPALVCLVAPDYSIPFANRQFREIFGDPQGCTCYDLVYGKKAPCPECNIKEILKSQQPVEWERTPPQGRTFQICNYPFADIDGSPMVLKLGTDITERKALESQLLQSQKMEAVGRLAGGVAHDFNNLLMAIMGYGELIRAGLLKDDPHYHYVEDILKAAERAASLTQQLLAFSRQQMIQPQILRLNRVAADLERMLRRLIGEHIDLEIVAAPDLGLVKADPGQIGQIIMNLAINARDAMPKGGQLTLETANIDFTAGHQCYIEVAPPGRYVMLAVSDAGGGMDAETLAHIFEPFFTTKEVGKGTGLGLPMVYGIVRQNQGYVEVNSRPGQGTTFRIYLPRLEAAQEPPKPQKTLAAKLEGTETILIVEDEEALRTLLCRFFRLYGYNVLEARHGGEALLICERHQEPIHLMVTDVVMPHMSGQELAARLGPLHPEMQVFFMSGYTDSDLAPYGVLEAGQPFITKPFRPMDLIKKAREFLDTSRFE